MPEDMGICLRGMAPWGSGSGKAQTVRNVFALLSRLDAAILQTRWGELRGRLPLDVPDLSQEEAGPIEMHFSAQPLKFLNMLRALWGESSG